jgi:hypothetical protein
VNAGNRESCLQREHTYTGAQSIDSQKVTEAGGADLPERILSRNHLNRAYERAKANEGTPGIGGMTIDEALPWLREHWEEPYSRKAYWRSARHVSVQMAITNKRLARAGYVHRSGRYESLHLCD